MLNVRVTRIESILIRIPFIIV